MIYALGAGVIALRVPGLKPVTVDCLLLLEGQQPRALKGTSGNETDNLTTVGALVLHVGHLRSGVGHPGGGRRPQQPPPLRDRSGRCTFAFVARRLCSIKNRLKTRTLQSFVQAFLLDNKKT